MDAELAVGVAQVVLDRLRAEEHGCRGFARGPAAGEEERDLELLRGQAAEPARVARSDALTRRGELGAGGPGPRRGAEIVEDVERASQVLARADALAGASQPGAVGELCPRRLERVRRAGVDSERFAEGTVRVLVSGQQRATPRRAGQRPGLALLPGCIRERHEGVDGFFGAPQAQEGLDFLGSGREIGVGDPACEHHGAPLVCAGQHSFRIAEPQLEVAERSERPDLGQPGALLACELECLDGVLAAGVAPADPRFEPRQTRERAREHHGLPRLTREPDRLVEAGLGVDPAVGARVQDREVREQAGEGADGRTGAGVRDGAVDERTAAVGFAQPERADRREREQPRVGAWMIVEPRAGDRVEENLNPVGRAYYGFSTLLCTPSSLAQEVGLALGAQAGEARIKEVVLGAGFSSFKRVAETPFNMVFAAKP